MTVKLTDLPTSFAVPGPEVEAARNAHGRLWLALTNGGIATVGPGKWHVTEGCLPDLGPIHVGSVIAIDR